MKVAIKSRSSRLLIGRVRIVTLLEPRAAGTIRFVVLTNAPFRMPSTTRKSAKLEGSSRITRHFLRGSRAFYHIACPSCGEFQEPGWALLRFDDMCLRCTSCNGFFNQDSWQGSVGEWRESAPNPHHKSFQSSALISPLIRWETIVSEYRDAVAALEAGDSSLIQVWENSRMGKVYSGRVEKIESGELYERRECFS